LEDAKTGLEVERARLQAQVRDLERQQLQTSHQLQSAHEELQRSHATSAQIQSEEKELQARLTTEIEERERAQQELHQLKKQVRSFFIFCTSFTKAWSYCCLVHIFTACVSEIGRWDSPVRIVSKLLACQPRYQVSIPGNREIFLFSVMFRPALEPTEPPSHCILGAVSQMGKLAGV
jgi:regulator of replication initiation timing